MADRFFVTFGAILLMRWVTTNYFKALPTHHSHKFKQTMLDLIDSRTNQTFFRLTELLRNCPDGKLGREALLNLTEERGSTLKLHKRMVLGLKKLGAVGACDSAKNTSKRLRLATSFLHEFEKVAKTPLFFWHNRSWEQGKNINVI